jgi:hypothetical protein
VCTQKSRESEKKLKLEPAYWKDSKQDTQKNFVFRDVRLRAFFPRKLNSIHLHKRFGGSLCSFLMEEGILGPTGRHAKTKIQRGKKKTGIDARSFDSGQRGMKKNSEKASERPRLS